QARSHSPRPTRTDSWRRTKGDGLKGSKSMELGAKARDAKRRIVLEETKFSFATFFQPVDTARELRAAAGAGLQRKARSSPGAGPPQNWGTGCGIWRLRATCENGSQGSAYPTRSSRPCLARDREIRENATRPSHERVDAARVRRLGQRLTVLIQGNDRPRRIVDAECPFAPDAGVAIGPRSVPGRLRQTFDYEVVSNLLR